MHKPDYLITEFDPRLRILHVAYRKRVHPTTKEHLDIIFDTFRKKLDQYLDSGRIHLVIDMTNFIIEPDLRLDYVSHAQDITAKYIIPNGIARYGFQITRITVRACYDQYMVDNPNIFNSRDEAYQHIYSLIEKNQNIEKSAAVSTPNANSSNY